MPNVSNFGTQTDNAVVQGTVTDRAMAIPDIPPSGLMSVGPRVTPHFVKPSLWSALTTYHFFDAVHDAAGASYVATKPEVPAGTELTNEDYWFLWADPNSQFADLSELVKTFNRRITQNTADIATKAPNNHASEETSYGVGNEVNYGHVRLAADDTPLTSGANEGIAATPAFMKTRFVTPKDFGAIGNGAADDTEAFLNALQFASSKRLAVILNGTFALGDMNVDVANPVCIYGAVPNVNSTVADTPTIPDIIVNGTITLSNVTSLSFNNVTFKASSQTSIIKIASFRNTFSHCAFTGFTVALNTVEGSKWVGENKILNCTFHNCATCIKLDHGSDGDIDGCLVDATCGSFITSTNDAGYKITRNHSYGRGQTTLLGVNTLVEGNYFDGLSQLVITGVGACTINGNLFLGTEKTTEQFAIKYAASIVNNGSVTGNAVVIGDLSKTYNVVFIDTSQCNYFNAVTVSGNNITQCQKAISKTSFYTYPVQSKSANGYTVLFSATAEPKVNSIYFTPYIGYGLFEYEGSVNVADIIQPPSTASGYVHIIEETRASGTTTTVSFERKITIHAYNDLTKIRVRSFIFPINFQMPDSNFV